MAFVSLGGTGPWWPANPQDVTVQPAAQSVVIDATGELCAYMGRVWNPSRSTKSVERVGFRFGTVTKAGGSGLTVSLQDVSLTSGGPMQPDGVQDQTVAIANGNASFASNTWIRTGTLSANRSVAYQELLAVVIEFDGSGRLGADSVAISATQTMSSGGQRQAGVSHYTGSWAAQQAAPNIVLEYSDGTFGALEGGWPYSAINNHTYNSGTGTADEYAMEFTVPVPVKVDAIWAPVGVAGATSDFDIVLYEGTTALATVSVDGNHSSTTSARGCFVPIPEQTLSTSSTYRIAVKPTTANNVTAYSIDVSDANHLTLLPGGTAFTYTTRLDSGSWAAATATRRMYAGVRISAIHDGSGGGSSGAAALINGGLIR